MKLNLGCGNKILPGYTNVDTVDSRNGMKPDVVCDIRDLKEFDDCVADEILNVHVIEHFYYWEIPALLKEWIRVLKPGGKLVTETPNLLTACQQVVNNPYKASRPDANMSMWPLYGNPFEQDPLMCHKWLFTPETLGDLLTQVGMANIRQEPAQYKMREPRDFRVVSEKVNHKYIEER